jgi:ADP-glucose pyrophosphorylase
LVSHIFSDIFAQGTNMQLKILAFVLAGAEGARLYPLTRDCAKPAVPFGPKYRIVDFVLSNLINSGIYSIYVLVQFRSQSLLHHLSDGWQLGGVRRIWACLAQIEAAAQEIPHTGEAFSLELRLPALSSIVLKPAPTDTAPTNGN